MRLWFLFFVVLISFGLLGSQMLFLSGRSQGHDRPSHAWSKGADEVAANGVVEGARPELQLHAEVVGRLSVRHVRENDEVAQGQLLAELHNETQKRQVELAAAELAQAQVDLVKLRNGARTEKREALAAIEKARQAVYQQAKATYERCQRLVERQTISTEQWEAARFNLLRAEAEWQQARSELALIEAPPRPEDVASAEARVAGARARLNLAKADLAKMRLTAPCKGRILQVHVEPGEMVGPTSPRPVLILADLSKRRVRAFVEELDVARVKVGQKAVVTADGFKGKEWSGTVAELLPRMGKGGPQSDAPGEYRDVYYQQVLIDLLPADELPTNLRVHVRIKVKNDPEIPQK